MREHCELRGGDTGRVGVAAYHGGNLEVGTDRIAAAVAEQSGASLYTVCQPDDLRWHIPSKQVRPSCSERLANFVDHIDVVITVHGFGRRSMFTTILLGGRNRALAGHVAAALRRTLPMYEIVDDLDTIPRPLRGQHTANPVNLPRLHGVQIELPPRVRGNGPFWNAWRTHGDAWPSPHTERLINGLSGAVASAPDVVARR